MKEACFKFLKIICYYLLDINVSSWSFKLYRVQEQLKHNLNTFWNCFGVDVVIMMSILKINPCLLFQLMKQACFKFSKVIC